MAVHTGYYVNSKKPCPNNNVYALKSLVKRLLFVSFEHPENMHFFAQCLLTPTTRGGRGEG